MELIPRRTGRQQRWQQHQLRHSNVAAGRDMTCNGGSTTMRNIPDVACVADGIWVVVNNGEQGVAAGTSASAPLWAGFAALVNQQAAASGQPSIGFINPAIYAIGKSSGYAAAFHDTTTRQQHQHLLRPQQVLRRPRLRPLHRLGHARPAATSSPRCWHRPPRCASRQPRRSRSPGPSADPSARRRRASC